MTVLRPQPKPEQSPSAPLLPRQDPILRLPVLTLYPHSRCNCRCLMCDIWRAKDRHELAPEDVARWLAEWRALGVRRVVLSGGEALLHARLWELCRHLRAADIGITLLSTGLLLKRHAAELVRYCDDVIVSLDGPQPIHDQIRSLPRAYAKMAEGVAAVKAADGRVAVSGRCTVQRANFQFLRATVAAAHALGLDRISFLAADVSSEAFHRPGGWQPERAAQVALQAEDLPLLAAELEALEAEHQADFADGYIAESQEKLRRRLLQYFAALLGQGDFYPNTCNAPWVSSVIEADGTLRPCFFQPPLGNIYQAGSLEAVLNSPQAIAFRRSLDVTTNPICRRCVCTLALREDLSKIKSDAS
ncbi:MAG TPA: radical SAM protein [Chthonomonadaceae bacterium]|nr:radical SAM protein [Chthonomonadaceae bacterium]